MRSNLRSPRILATQITHCRVHSCAFCCWKTDATDLLMLSIIWEISSVDQFRTEEHPVRSMHWTMRRRSLPLRKVATSVYYTHRCISCCQQSCFLTNCCFSVQALLPSKSSFVFSLIKSVEIALHSILCSSMMITDQCGTHNAHTKHFQALVRLVLRRCMHWSWLQCPLLSDHCGNYGREMGGPWGLWWGEGERS